MRINLFCVCLIYSWERSATCINEYPLVERFMYLFMCVVQWISICEIHFGSRGYSFGIAIIFFPHPPSPNLNFLWLIILLQKKDSCCLSFCCFKKNDVQRVMEREHLRFQQHLRVVIIRSTIHIGSFHAFDPPFFVASDN